MAGATGKIPVGHRIPINVDHELEFSDGVVSFADMVFGFFEDGGEGSTGSFSSSGDDSVEDLEEDHSENLGDLGESKAFWEDQHQILQTTLYRTSSLESKIRRATKEALRESQLSGPICSCWKRVSGGCRDCLLKDVSDRLGKVGFNSAVCKSKWRRSPDIPSGEHTYMDVVDKPSSKKGEVRVVIELNFRAEFEMARASEEYNKLINQLPEVFVGKAERLHTLIKILCSAAKKCMKENKMHMGPWRKHKYMQAKWFGSCERTMSAPLPNGFSDRPRKPKASLLTYDLLEKLPSLQHFTAVEVV